LANSCDAPSTPVVLARIEALKRLLWNVAPPSEFDV
jgi:hypothetical protein